MDLEGEGAAGVDDLDQEGKLSGQVAEVFFDPSTLEGPRGWDPYQASA